MTGSAITVLAGKGGCGKTTLATNLAVVLSSWPSVQRVCLVDLDFAQGDIATSLGLSSSVTLTAAMTSDGDLDVRQLPILVTPYADGLDCLLAPARPGESERISARFVEQLISALRARYDWVVIDTPDHISTHVLAALDSSDHHILMTTPDYPALKNLRLTLDILDLLAHNDASRWILSNRCDVNSGLADEEIEHAVRGQITARLPFSADVSASLNEELPLGTRIAGHPVIAAISEFARARLGDGAPSGEGGGLSRRPIRKAQPRP